MKLVPRPFVIKFSQYDCLCAIIPEKFDWHFLAPKDCNLTTNYNIKLIASSEISWGEGSVSRKSVITSRTVRVGALSMANLHHWIS
jgi:hypothetical protein